ncbi:MAG: T9SS type A sorting domain-containing protein, partial [Chitinophagaceae bacterium]|nr:T9SS type A sorting domain-containing protein [Chitinophagaceae bacterium]
QLSGNAVNLASGSVGDAWNNGNNPTIPFASTLDQSSAAPLSFKPVQAGVDIHWASVSEKRVSSYTLESSENAKDFSPLQTQAHQTNQAEYSYTDRRPSQGARYYRLQVTDEDGKTYSTLAQKYNFNVQESAIQIFPTFVENGQLNITGIESTNNVSIVVLDVFGRIQKSCHYENGILHVTNLPTGTYIVHISQQGHVLMNQKIQIK